MEKEFMGFWVCAVLQRDVDAALPDVNKQKHAGTLEGLPRNRQTSTARETR